MSAGSRATARRIAWVAFVLGSVASVAANIAHTLTPPAYVLAAWVRAGNQPDALGWSTPPGAVVAAAWSPVALLFTVELLTRVPWPSSAWRALPRYAAVVVVATVAAVVSYRHMAGLLASYGEDGLTAAIEPLSVDGLMVISALALLALSRSADLADGGRGAGDPAADTRTAPSPSPAPAPAAVGASHGGSVTAPTRAPRPAARSRRTGARPTTPAPADLLPVGRAVAVDLAREGRPLTRAALIEGVRARGHRLSTTRATDLLRQLRTPTAAPEDPAPADLASGDARPNDPAATAAA